MKKWITVIAAALLLGFGVFQFERGIAWVLGPILPEGSPFLTPPDLGFPDAARAALQRSVLWFKIWQWLSFGILGLFTSVALRIARSVVRRIVGIINGRNPGRVADSVTNLAALGCGLLAVVWVVQPLIPDLLLGVRLDRALNLFFEALTVLGGVLIAYAVWDATCDQIAAKATGYERAERLLVPLTRKLVRALIIGVGFLVAIGVIYGTKAIGSLVATLGISGLVIALAAKDSVENVFGSLTILFDMPFALGDWVKINNVEGVVEEINLRSTRIRTFEDTIILLPNANLIRASVENYGQRRVRRQRFHLRLSYDCTPEQIADYCQRLKADINRHPEVVTDRTLVDMNDPTESSLGVLVQCFLEVPTFDDESRVRHTILESCLALREPTGVVFAAAPRPANPA